MFNTKIIDSYKEYGRVLCLSNEEIEAYVTIDLGPRIIRFGYIGGQNILCDTRSKFTPRKGEEYDALWGKGRHWENYGGHRIWVTPETFPETYSPDDEPVEYTITENGAIFEFAEEATGIKKQLEIRLDADDANMEVINRVKNISADKKEFSIWSISVSSKGGKLVIPMNQKDTGLLANRVIAVWPYTDLSDKRIHFFDKYVVLDHDENAKRPAKLGFDLDCGTVFYVLGKDTFSKSFTTEHGQREYPDGGCSFETYTCGIMTEVESLSPITEVAAGDTAEYTERWSLYKTPENTDLSTESGVEKFLNSL